MLRYTSRAVLASGVVMFTAGPAAAAPQASPPPMLTSRGLPGRRITIDTPIEISPRLAPAAPVSTTLYLERCKGRCIVLQGTNDARTNTSMIPRSAASTIGEFANSAGQIGSAADAEWAQLVRCMKEVYSPYNIVVTDVKPASGTYHEAIVAGQPQDIGYSSDILGVAPLASDCRAIDDVISFTFASNHPNDPTSVYVPNICWTAAQESAHAYGLDHEYSFPTNVSFPDLLSACNDPMTYRSDCGGEKFFRNEAARCGEEVVRACKCGTLQNSHAKLMSVFGAGTPITAKPTISITDPAASGGVLGRVVTADAGAQRGVARVEVYFNGFKWGQVPGVKFQKDGQPDPSTYSIAVPAALPDSIVDVKTIAFDDLEIASESAVVTVTKGAPCATADTCAEGQKCEAGKCFWDLPSGEIGDSCSYPQFCKSMLCQDAKGQQICTQACDPGVAGSCPTGFACMTSGTPGGSCFPAVSTGRGDCSADRGGQGWLMYGGIAATLLGFLARRRRR